MASMRDKLKKLVGKKISFNGSTISRFHSGEYYYEITEVGDDYFVIDMIFINKKEASSFYPITYAISEVKAIQGGL